MVTKSVWIRCIILIFLLSVLGLTTEQKQTYLNAYKNGNWNIVFGIIPVEYQSGAMATDFAGDLENLISEEKEN